MTVQRTDNEIIIKLPASMDVEEIQRLINYLAYKEAVKNSKATQEQIDELASDVNKQWWAENKDKFLPS